MSYTVDQIKDNIHNNYKYQYLDHVEGIIDIRDNFWNMYLQLFCVNNYNLPLNTLIGSLELPYQSISNIVFNKASDQSKASTIEWNAKYCKIFESTFSIDVAQNEFFKQDLINIPVAFNLNLEIDPEPIEKAGVSVSEDALDSLMVETSEQHWSFEAYYSNSSNIKEETTINTINGFIIDSNNICYPKVEILNVDVNTYVNVTQSITNLLKIRAEKPFQIVSAKVKFKYWMELDSQEKTIEFSPHFDCMLQNEYDAIIDIPTLFDYAKNEVYSDPHGVKGFYVPLNCKGNYEINIKLVQNNNLYNLNLTNNFNFVKVSDKPYVIANQIEINDLTGFKEVSF